MLTLFRYADITCGFGVDYYPRDKSASDNSCPDRSEGEHVFDHPFVQVGVCVCVCVCVKLTIVV